MTNEKNDKQQQQRGSIFESKRMETKQKANRKTRCSSGVGDGDGGKPLLHKHCCLSI